MPIRTFLMVLSALLVPLPPTITVGLSLLTPGPGLCQIFPWAC